MLDNGVYRTASPSPVQLYENCRIAQDRTAGSGLLDIKASQVGMYLHVRLWYVIVRYPLTSSLVFHLQGGFGC